MIWEINLLLGRFRNPKFDIDFNGMQPVWSYSASKGERIPFVVRLYLHFLTSIWPVIGTLTRTTSPGESGPGSNGHGGILHTPQISRTETSQPVAV